MFQQWGVMSNIILNIFWILTLLVFVWVIYSIVYSIFMFIFSWGNEEKIKKAWASIRYAILWFILTLIILVALPWLLRAIKVPWYEQYTPENIFQSSKSWVTKIMGVFKQGDTSDDEYSDYGGL